MKLQNLLKSKNIFNFLIAFLIFDFLFLILAFAPQGAKAQEASLYLSPLKGSYAVGENFSVSVFVNTEGAAINAAQAKIFFPPEKLKVLSISKSGSIFSLWVQEPVFSNSQGTISFGGGLPSPGFSGKSGKVITILFWGKSQGEAKVNFDKEIITANDPWGTNVFSFSQGGTYSLIVSEELPPLEELPPRLPEIDTEPPYPFEITIDNEGDPANPQPLLYFEAKDDISGISHYEIKIGVGDTFKVFEAQINPFRLPHQAPGTHSIIVRAVDKAGNYRESVTEIKVELIEAPKITVCPDTFISGEEVLHIEGTALPNHTIIVFLKSGEKLIKSQEVFSNEKGEWSFEEEGLFKSGIYKISVRAKNPKGAISHPSEECVFKIILSGLAVGPWIISYKSLVWIFLIILILILLLIFYLVRKAKRTRKLIEKETQDLKQKFYKEYKELENDILKELEVLEKIRGERKITEEEKKREGELLKNLEDIERVLKEELKDIEEIR